MMRMIMGGTGQEPGWFLLKIRGGLGELGECGAEGGFYFAHSLSFVRTGEVGCLGQSSGG